MMNQVEMELMSVSTFFRHKKFLFYSSKIKQKIIVPR